MNRSVKCILCGICAAFLLFSAGCGDDKQKTAAPTVENKVITLDEKPRKLSYLAVVSSSPVTTDDLKAIGNSLISKAGKDKNVFVSFSDTDLKGVPYTYGSMQRVDGKVSEAIRVNKTWENKPKDSDYKTFLRYQDFMIKNPKASYTDFVVSYQSGLTPDAAKASVDKVQQWILQ